MIDGISKASGRDSFLLDLRGWINDGRVDSAMCSCVRIVDGLLIPG